MATTFLEPGGDATFNLATTTAGGFWQSIGGFGGSIGSSNVHGTHARTINCGAGSQSRLLTPDAVVANAGSRISFYVYVNVLPTANTSFLSVRNAAGALEVVTLQLTSGGVLQLWNGVSAQIGSSGPTLSTARWYRVSLAYTLTSTSVNRFEVFVDAVSAISVTNATITNTTSSTVDFGISSPDANFNINISDMYVDNLSTLVDTGNIWVTAKRPNANGTTNGFTTQIGSGGSGYGTGHSPQVNERPLSTTNGWSMIGAGSAITEEYNIEGQGVGDITTVGGTIIDYTGWVSASAALSETGSIIVNNVSSNISLTSTKTVFTKVAGSATYPAGTGTDIGIVTSTTVTTVSLYECGVLVAFIPAAVVASTVSPLSLLGAG